MEESLFFKLANAHNCPYSVRKKEFLHIQLIAFHDGEPSC